MWYISLLYMKNLCPCCSGKPYDDCCMPFHEGSIPSSAELLMRSRYSAYALNLADYIIATTHPLNSHYSCDVPLWKEEIEAFSRQSVFERLDVLDHREIQEKAYVVFIAHLKYAGDDATFTERSAFEKIEGRWLYLSGETFPGIQLDLMA